MKKRKRLGGSLLTLNSHFYMAQITKINDVVATGVTNVSGLFGAEIRNSGNYVIGGWPLSGTTLQKKDWASTIQMPSYPPVVSANYFGSDLGQPGLQLVKIQVGYYGGVGLDSSGGLWFFNYSNDNYTPNGTNYFEWTKYGTDTWTDVGYGFHHWVAIKSDGTLWGGGNNSYGQLGTGNTSSPNKNVVNISTATDHTKLAVGYPSTFIVQGGVLKSAGYNYNGGTGQNTSSGNTLNFTACSFSVSTPTVLEIATGLYGCAIIDSNYNIWSTGFNQYGQQGTGNTTNQLQFGQRTTGIQFRAIFGIGVAFKALLADGTHYHVGYGNTRGDGSSSNLNVYTQIGSVRFSTFALQFAYYAYSAFGKESGTENWYSVGFGAAQGANRNQTSNGSSWVQFPTTGAGSIPAGATCGAYPVSSTRNLLIISKS